MNTNKQKYLIHKKIFNIKTDRHLKIFDDLLNNLKDYLLECSCKIKYNKVYYKRFNIWCTNKNYIETTKKIFNFMERISQINNVKINYTLIRKVLDKHFNINKIKGLVFGIDFRTDLKDSRIKLWFTMENYPEGLKKILSFYEPNKELNLLCAGRELLFGFDFSFSGKTKIRIYPRLTKKDLERTVFRNMFENKLLKLIDQCYEIRVSLNMDDSKKIIHFSPSNIDSFIKQIDNDSLKKIKFKLKNNSIDIKIISLYEDEILNENIININIYY